MFLNIYTSVAFSLYFFTAAYLFLLTLKTVVRTADYILLVLCLLLVSGICESVLITQWPHYISTPSNARVEMHCYQNDTEYPYMYWYRQLKGRDIQLIVYLVANTLNFETEFKTGFEAKQLKNKQSSLILSSVLEKDEAVYLCAASSTVWQQTLAL